jgi:hypothetical protein
VSPRRRGGAGGLTTSGHLSQITRRLASDPVRDRTQDTATAVAYEPAPGRGEWAIVARCPDGHHHQHRAKVLPPEGIVRRRPCDGGHYRLRPVVVVIAFHDGGAA